MIGRHRKGHSSKLPPRARTIPLRGLDEDKGRYFRCWHCGFICDAKRDALGGPEERHGMTSEFYYQTYPQSTGNARGLFSSFSLDEEGANSGIALARMCRIQEMCHIGMEADADGTAKKIRLTYSPKVGSGCPACGCKNWRGDHR
jgi:hypothetical protein